MKIGVIGTGVVGNALGTKLSQLGHEVKMGARVAGNENAVAWAKAAGPKASQGTFADAAAFGDLLLNCTGGANSLAALQAAGAKNMAGKLLIDVSNPLDFSRGMPPTLTVTNTDSLGEQIQRAFPETKVVKALNTVANTVMINPGLLAGDHDLFICGNDAAAKAQVTEILKGWFGWQTVVDVGDITAARATEGVLPLWVRLYGKFQTPLFNFHIVH
jgi:predicted dinucleotide-binding enzyme